MSIDFQQAQTPSLLDKLLRGYIDWAQHEKEQMAELLMAIIWKDDASAALINAHDKFKQGLRFLNVLGNEYGLAMITNYGSAPKQGDGHERMLAAIYPKAREEAKRILTCLVSGKIKFTGTYTNEGCPEYVEI
ncbi:MAG: hypothetical protein EOO39_06665 [Cytophagaceae bacterium]|nr:MAG: hypothetical protein EOO39_06665 [Cytophagaceae bacterium]